MLVFVLRVILNFQLINFPFIFETNIITAVPNFVWQILISGVELTAVVIVVLKGRSGKGKETFEAIL